MISTVIMNLQFTKCLQILRLEVGAPSLGRQSWWEGAGRVVAETPSLLSKHLTKIPPFQTLFITWKWKWETLSRVWLFVTPWSSPGQNTGVSSLSLLQGIFPTQELNSGLLHCRRILYRLSHKGRLFVTPWSSPGQNTGVGSLSLLQRIFPTQELNQGLLRCRRILYQLSYQGS